MTDLAAQRVAMDAVLNRVGGVFCVDAFVAVDASRRQGHIVATIVCGAVPMHLRAAVAAHAVEEPGTMHIRRDPFVPPEVLPLDPAAVTGDADLVHGRFFLEGMG